MAEFDDYIQTPVSSSTIELELEQSYPYYKLLTPALKNRFVQRTSEFISSKKFVGRQQLRVTEQIRIIVSACEVQVTFGLDSFLLDNFEYVVIYPAEYQSPVTGKWHKGETNLNGFICLSWKDIVTGIENPDDNYNLGLHEWTHALRFNGIKYEETDYFFDSYINKWLGFAMHEYNILKNGKPSIFRRYGATNIHEFLSVSIEHFFESPDEFKLKAPALYDQTCILLNQIPSKKESAKIFVRNNLMELNTSLDENCEPELVFEASFWRTLLNFGTRLLYFAVTIFILLFQQNVPTLILALLTILLGVVIMNNEFFTIKFYKDHIYFQKGFVSSMATTLSLNYSSLIKFEIYEGNYESNMGTVFEINYYDGARFIRKTAYCSTDSIPKDKIKELLLEKNVAVFFPN